MTTATKTAAIGLKNSLLLCLPLLLGGFFLVKALSVGAGAQADPASLEALTGTLLRGLYFTGVLSCLFLSLRTWRKMRKPRG